MSNQKEANNADQNAGIDTARVLGVRARLLDSLIDDGYYMLQEYLVKSGKEFFSLEHLNEKFESVEISSNEWEWVKENYSYSTEETEGNYYVTKRYVF